LILLTIRSTSKANVILNNLVRAITLHTGCGIESESIVGNTLRTYQFATVGGIYLILLAARNSSIASIIHNNLFLVITLDTGRGIVSESIECITLRTNQCTGSSGVTNLILLTIKSTSKANVTQNNLVRGITLDTYQG
jgi:hypothetical protein